MTINIAYLYHDLMNLYGESGNIKVLEYLLIKQGIKPIITKLSIDDKIEFSKYDIFYIGCGTEENRLLVLKHIIKYKKFIKTSIEDNKFFLVTGNALSLFGDYILDNDTKTKCLGLFSIHEVLKEERDVREVSVAFKLIPDDIYGFINKQGIIYKDDEEELKSDSLFYKNFYGTYLLGPILARNPQYTKYLITNLIRSKNPKFKFKQFDLKSEENAYYEFIDFKDSKK